MNKDWIEKDGIASYIQTIYDLVAESVADYGYNNRFADPEKLVGRASEMVEYMAVFIKPGKQEKFMEAAGRMGVAVQPEKLIAPGAKEAGECYTFVSGSYMNMNNKIFRQIVRRAVKDAQARMAMMARAGEMRR
ncbi:hypothetical protein HDR61_01955 [bacterium]|nr:hypothetical protein [bacterium]